MRYLVGAGNKVDFDVAIIGSGPAGVSAAWPLVRSGARISILDQGRDGPGSGSPEMSFLDIRKHDLEQWRTYIGEDFTGLGGGANETPKFKVPLHRHVWDGFIDAYGITATGLNPTGSLARGGISKMWGAGPYAYNDDDLSRFPIEARDLEAGYRAVAQRIGISGVDDDDISAYLGAKIPLQNPIQLHPNAEYLLSQYSSSRRRNQILTLGRARNAVITEDLGRRRACTLTNRCFWGCPQGSIYSADQEIADLQLQENFDYLPGAFVEKLDHINDN